MEGARHTARLVLLNGPPAAGKSTAAAAVLDEFGRDGRLAVLEHDAFAEMGGAHLDGRTGADDDGATSVWDTALEALAAAAKAYLEAGMSVLVVVNYGVGRKALLERMFAPHEPRHVVLLPPWSTNHDRVLSRSAREDAPRLADISEQAHRQFRADLTAMARSGEFDDVITSARIRPETIARRVAQHLGLTGPGHAST